MPRSVNAVASRARRKKVLKQTKGYFGRRKNVYTVAKNTLEKGLQYAYRDRRQKKRNFRALWIQRINAGTRLHGMSYSTFMGKLHAKDIQLNRKVLADRSKVPAAVEAFGDNYCLLGPLENENISAEFEPISQLNDPIGRTVEKMRNMGLEVWYGRWLVTGRPRVVLLNPQNVYNRLDTLHRHLKVDFGINTHREDRSHRN